MRALLGFLILVGPGFSAQADVIHCSQYVAQDAKMARAVEYLRSIAGTFELGDCSVELHVCGDYAADRSPGSLVGDLLITDRQGQKRYVQFDFPEGKSPGTRVEVLNGQIMLHYEFDDTNGSADFGHRESVRLEFLKSESLHQLTSLEEGWYSTRDWQARRTGSVYRWTLCHGHHPL